MILLISFTALTLAIALLLSASSDQQWETMVSGNLDLDKMYREMAGNK